MSASIRVRKIRVGDEVPAACGRCKGERTHQVVALNQDGTPASVICGTCGGRHNYREKRTERSNARTATRETKQIPSAPRKPARQYSPREAFSEGDWIEHSKFGQGEVIGIREGKIEVKFGTEKRILIHAQ
jgi:hypothetical protein